MKIEDLEGFISIPGGYQLLDEKPLDSRFLGKDLEFLQSIVDIGAAYPGLRVFIVDENKEYIYKKDSKGEYGFVDIPVSIQLTSEEKAVLSSGLTKNRLNEIENNLKNKYSVPVGGILEETLSEGVKNKLNSAVSKSEVIELSEKLNSKVDKVDNKQLSDENFTSRYKSKLDSVNPGAEPNTISSIKINGKTQIPNSEKEINLSLSKINDKSLLSDTSFGLVDLKENQVIDGEKSFSKLRITEDYKDIDLAKPIDKKPVTEPQVVKALEEVKNDINSSSIDASKLTGTIPSGVKFPTDINTNIEGNSASTNKLKNPVKIKISGKASSTEEYDFDGGKDLDIKIDSISIGKDDIPILNQDTTGNAATATTAETATKLKNKVKLKVDLNNSGDSSEFDGSTDIENIPITGRLGVDNLLQGEGTGQKRKVLGTTKESGLGNLGLVELEPEDVGLGKLDKDKYYVTTEKFNELEELVNRIKNLGNFIGSYNTYDDLPVNTESIKDVYGVTPKINDFVTVRGGSYGDNSPILPGSTTCWSIIDIDVNDNITWAYESTYSQDITGKIDKITSSVKEGYIPKITADGGLETSGILDTDIVTNSKLNEKLKNSLENYALKDGTISKAKNLVDEDGKPVTKGNSDTPVFFNNGKVEECFNVPKISEDGKTLLSKNNEDLKVKESSISDGTKHLLNSEGEILEGGPLRPIYLDENSNFKVTDGSLGDLAFEKIPIPVDILSDMMNNPDKEFNLTGYIGVKGIGVKYSKLEGNKDYIPGRLFSLTWDVEKEDTPSTEDLNRGSKFYCLIVNCKEGPELQTLRKNLGQLINPEGGEDGTEGVFFDSKTRYSGTGHTIPKSAESGGYGFPGVPKVRLLEIQGKLYNPKTNGEEDTTNDSTLHFSLVETYYGFKVNQAGNVIINTGVKYAYDPKNEVSQGVYLVEISR